MGAVTAEQFDLITDDPRREEYPGMMAEISQFYQASRELGGLLGQSQAARILEVNQGMITKWINKGRLQSRVVAGVRMVSGAEVKALYLERANGERLKGGRGNKAPTLVELTNLAWQDCFENS